MATKNLLAAVMNAAAILIFAFSRDVAGKQVVALGAGAIVGGQVGAYAFQRVNEKVLQVCITLFGLDWRSAYSGTHTRLAAVLAEQAYFVLR